MTEKIHATSEPSPNAFWNTFGRDMKVRLAPIPTSSGFIPILKMDGKMMNPAIIAIKVSMTDTFKAVLARGVDFSK